MPAYDRTKFVTNTALDSVLFDYMQDSADFVVPYVFTPKPVKKTDNRVYQADTSKLRRFDSRAGTNSEAKLIDEQLFARNFKLDEFKLGTEINPRDVRDADIPAFFEETRKAKVVTQSLMIDREILGATIATTAGNYATGLTSSLALGSRWDDTGDPEAQKQTADQALQLASGIKRANAMVCDIQVLRKLRNNQTFIDRKKYTNGGPLNMEIFKEYFSVDYIFVAGTVYDSANEGGTRTLASPWGKDALFYYYNPSNGLEDISFAHMYMAETAFWTKTILDERRNGIAGPMKRLEVGTEYLLDKGYIESEVSNKFAAGYLYKNVIS